MSKNKGSLSKKENEKNLLHSIYKEDHYTYIQDSEEPDFIIYSKHNRNLFGVEVTELYYNETNARMRNLHNYSMDLLDGKDFKHKDDKKNIEIGFPKLISDNGEEREVKALIREVPKLFDYLAKVRELIAIKNNRFDSYNNELSHINLIIADTERYFVGKQLTLFYSTFVNEEIIQVILNSQFREIFFITTVQKNRKVYIPLKMLLFVARYVQFKEFINSNYEDLIINEKKSVELFCSSLIAQGFKDLRILNVQNAYEIIFGNTGIILAIGQNTNVHMYSDNTIPEEAALYGSNCKNVDQKIIEHFNKDVMETTFMGEVGFDCIKY